LRQRVVPDSAAPRDAMLFVGRKDVRYRYVVTQESIVAYLGKSRNWEAIFPEFMTIDQAIGRFSSAAAIILPVGSAKFNLIFCRPGTHVVCVMPAGYAEGNMGVTGMIRHMCHALGLKLDFYSCAIERNPQVLLHSNLLISKDDLLRMLDLIDARRR
jgi:capsular polysaccharide biosynthesis protein